ncbi:hypothetical protein [Mesorhizobium sp.]|uniref:hypothetical protein n=1 Tax=Mesorhizobium sp. TaxID=1871066 RepID=UPI000FE97C55|nr:hypothetical protein [Mesorhizobium sp.]RWF33755.1 MAG: hypothetical protein EOS45_02155 [Mesorhizobium sp.]TIX43805.1 MAG: hypothetical protein E5V40_01825 [Mesorhizobium sp.]
MKIALKDGTTVERPFSPSNCIGYVATDITLTGADLRAMTSLFVRDKIAFEGALRQLEARFPENRVGGR